ncbi:MAG TPA: hypothetical protein VE961_23265 [Pyrinomonadaceae bacterium]|nr:hypothetical protein [Pyrinomonadaceae bacterium]
MILTSKTRLFSFIWCALLAAFVLLPLTPAQTSESEKAEQAAAKQQALEKSTLKLLDEVIAGAYGLKLGENRSYILISAADLLWPHDEKRARALYWEALGALNLPPYQEANPATPKTTDDSTKAAPSNGSTPNGPTKEQLADSKIYFARADTRMVFLRKVARRDPELALEMMRSTRPNPLPAVPGNAANDLETAFEQELTFAAAANDPKRALQVARDDLAKHLNFQVLNLLRDLNRKDQDAGTKLAGDIIAKLKTENLSDPTSFAPNMAFTLLQSSRTSGAVLVATSESESPGPITRLKLDDHQRQDLVFLITDAALNPTGGGNALQIIQWVMPEIEQYAPERMAKVKTRVAEYNRTLSPTMREWNDFSTQLQNATPEEMIGIFEKATNSQRNGLLYMAAAKAVESGAADRYRELLNSLDDETRRKEALDALNQEQWYNDIAHGNLDDLEKLLPMIRVKEQRAMAMAETAALLEKKDQHEAAVKLLDEARDLVKVNLTDYAQSNALLAVMFGYALVEPPKAFAMIEPVIDRTNDEVAKLLLLDKIAKSGATRNGEIILNQPQLPLDLQMTQFSPGIAALAKVDFDRTKALADRFQRSELKLVARMLLARALLKDPAPAKADSR